MFLETFECGINHATARAEAITPIIGAAVSTYDERQSCALCYKADESADESKK
jgi:hypothetical protein